MPTKERLRGDSLRWIIMTVAYELGKTEDEIVHWSVTTLKRWWTFFIVRAEEEAKAYERARRRAGGR
jgi:hypothetical protein